MATSIRSVADDRSIETQQTEQPVTAPAPGSDPAMVAIPTVIAGAVGLFLTTAGFVPASAGLAAIPVILSATCLGLLIGTVWAAWLGQNVVATLYAVFLGFYLSYAMLQLGLAHDWYKIPPDQIVNTVAVYLICWLVVIVMLTLATLRLPIAFTILLGLVDVALALLLANLYLGAAVLQIGASLFIFCFVALGVYLYFHVMSVAFGRKGLPLGAPIVSG